MAGAMPPLQVDFLPAKPNELRVRFPYDARLVDLIRTVPGRRYDPDTKTWRIPSQTLRALQTEAARWGITIQLDNAVLQAQEVGQRNKDELRALKDVEDVALDLPTETKVRNYQRVGIRFMWRALRGFKGVLLADDPGLGKTLQALSIVAMNANLQKVLVLCPASIKYVWEGEIQKHYPQLSYVVIDGLPERRAELWGSDARIKIANYELLNQRHERDCLRSNSEKRKADPKAPCTCGKVLRPDAALRTTEWDLVIADECTRLKSYKAQTPRIAKELERRYSIGLSGTPIENHLEELHSIMDFAVPGLLGPGWLFVQQHCVYRNGIHVGYKAVDVVREKIAPHYIRRRKADVLQELPPKVYNDVLLELSPAEWRIYTAIREQIVTMVGENPKLSVGNILTEMLRLKQCVNDVRLLGEDGIPSSKVSALWDTLEASEGHSLVVFTQFAEWAQILQKEFGGFLLYGAVSTDKRRDMIEAFQAGKETLLFSTEAGAYGITLTAADIVIHLDQPWNPARLIQREDRLHRIGQKSSVNVVNFIARRTIDEYVRKILHRKAALAKLVFQDEVEEAMQITKADLLSLLGAGE